MSSDLLIVWPIIGRAYAFGLEKSEETGKNAGARLAGESMDRRVLAVGRCFFAFRLILGRLPNREEWTGHSSRAGEPLVHVVRSYVNSEEFKARKLLEIALPPGIVRKHNGRFVVFADEADLVLGAPALMGVYEPHVSAAIEALLQPGDHFLDVGANLGYFSLLAAARVGDSVRVYSVELNELNVKLLESSRKSQQI